MKISKIKKTNYKTLKSSNIFDIFFYTMLGLIFGIIITITVFYTIYPKSLVKLVNVVNNNTGFGVYNDDISILNKTIKNNLFDDNSRIPIMKIDIKFKHWEKLNKKRNEAVSKGILFTKNDDFVPAKMEINNKKVNVKLRLKGDWTDHLEDNKWSFRIKIKNGDQVFGLKKFSIQNPKVRGYQGQLLINEIFKSYDLITPKYFFVKVIINGKDIGIMALEEHFSKELLERNKRKNSVIIKLDESLLWETRASNNFKDITFESYKNTFIDAFGKTKIYQSPKALKEYKLAVGLLRGFIENKLKASAVFDIDLLGRFLAISDFFNASHGVIWHNLRFYFNPLSMKLEPIPYDANLHEQSNMLKTMSITKDMLKDEEIKKVYLKTIEKLNTSLRDGSLIKMLKKLDSKYLSILQKEFFLLDSFNFNYLRIKEVKNKCSKYLNSDVPIYLHSNIVKKDNLNYLELSNAFCEDIEITSIYWENKEKNRKKINFTSDFKFPIILEKTDLKMLPNLLMLPFTKIKDKKYNLKIEARVKNQSKTIIHNSKEYYPSLDKDLIHPSTLTSLLEKYEFISLDTSCEKCLYIKSGKYTALDNIVIPKGYNLTITKNTILEFNENSNLVVFGSTKFLGTKNEPIILKGIKENTWQGVVVSNALTRSLWDNVFIKNTKGISLDSWELTGGVTFYKSNIDINNSSFIGNKGEDALNIVHSDFKLENIYILDTFSDGFDADFVTGQIINSTFKDIGFASGGDAVDLSGSKVSMTNISFNNISDKAISIGESSNLIANNINIYNSSVAVASKDNSSVKLNNVSVKLIRNIAFMSYMKKPVFGGSNLIATNVDFNNVANKTKVQYGSSMKVNNMDIKAEELNIKRLYDTIMKPMRKN